MHYYTEYIWPQHELGGGGYSLFHWVWLLEFGAI